MTDVLLQSRAHVIYVICHIIIVYYTLDFTPFRKYRICEWVGEWVGVWVWVRACVYSGDRDNVGERSCRRGDGGAVEQMTLTAERNNLAAATSRSIHRSRLRVRNRVQAEKCRQD